VLAKLCITQAKQTPATWCCSSPCATWIRRSATGGPA
jgi:hypothetical protein